MAKQNIVSKRVLSEILGISETSLTEWQKENPPMPVVAPGGLGIDGQYDTVECIRWMIDRAMRKAQIETPRDRLARVQADKVEMEISEKRGLTITASEIRPAFVGFAVEIGQAFRSMPANVVPLLTAMADDPDAMRGLLEETVDDILKRLANDERGTAIGAAGGAGTTGAAAEAVAVGVGGEASQDAGRSADPGPVSVHGDGVSAGNRRRKR